MEIRQKNCTGTYARDYNGMAEERMASTKRDRVKEREKITFKTNGNNPRSEASNPQSKHPIEMDIQGITYYTAGIFFISIN